MNKFILCMKISIFDALWLNQYFPPLHQFFPPVSFSILFHSSFLLLIWLASQILFYFWQLLRFLSPLSYSVNIPVYKFREHFTIAPLITGKERELQSYKNILVYNEIKYRKIYITSGHFEK